MSGGEKKKASLRDLHVKGRGQPQLACQSKDLDKALSSDREGTMILPGKQGSLGLSPRPYR